MRRRLLQSFLLALILAAVPAGAARAANYPPGFEERVMVSGLTAPIGVAWAPDGRMFVVEKEGKLKVVPPGGTTATTILDISNRVNEFGDRGLLGIAVDSDFASNNYIYLLYTYELAPLVADGSGQMVSRLGRFTVSSTNVVSAETPILGTRVSGTCPAPANNLDCIPSEGTSHSIGTVRSAPDGTLWVGSGDAAGFAQVDPLALRTYNEQSMAGKIMHIDRDGRGLPGHPFCPANATLTNICTKLWAKGFRNPYRFTLRPNGGLSVGDVGWTQREEVDLIGTGGRSYGWPCYEGFQRTPGYRDRSECSAEYAKEGTANAHVLPNYDYPHVGNSAILGGPTYTGNRYPGAFSGDIFFGDYAAGFLKRLKLDASGNVSSAIDFATDLYAVDIEQTPDGELAYVSFGDNPGTGSVMRIVYTLANGSPTAAMSATPANGPAPLAVSFDGSGSSDPDGNTLTYQWDFGDGASATGPTANHTYITAGNYSAKLTVNDGNGGTDTKSTVIAVGGSPPQATITSPAGGSTYRDGQTVDIGGTATDAQDGTLPASAFHWTVRVIHGNHVHPLTSFDAVRTASFATLDDHDADSFYEISLVVTDSSGLTDTKTVRIDPETVAYNIQSEPTGAPVTYSGESSAAPMARRSAIGYGTTISAADRFTANGREWAFDSWSDGGARQHGVTIPSTDTTVTARYVDAGPSSLVAAYGFEEGSGVSVADASGRGNGGTVSGAAWSSAGKFGKALDFDGLNDWVTVADSASLDLTTAGTIEAWVRSDNAAKAWQTVALKEDPAHGTLSYGLYATSSVPFTNGWWVEDSVWAPDGSRLEPGTWVHLALTLQGGTSRLFINGVQVDSRPVTGPASATTGPLRIGGNGIWSGEWFDGLIDEMRVYDRALSEAEIAADRDRAVGGAPPVDGTPPTVSISQPGGGTTVQGSVTVRATAADNVGVQNVQFTLDGQNLGSPDASSPYEATWNTVAVANGQHTLRAIARDAAGNSTTSAPITVTVNNPDAIPPTVAVSQPAGGATVQGSVTVRATAADNVGVQNVQFTLDGQNLGSPDASSPYEATWNTATVANGQHTLRAIARDAAANSTTSAAVTVTVNNVAAPSGLVAAYGFEEASGTSVVDASGRGNGGVVSGAVRATAGKFGKALDFDGVNDWVTVADSASLDLTTAGTVEAWVRSDNAAKAWQTVVLKEGQGLAPYALYATSSVSFSNGWWLEDSVWAPNGRRLVTGTWLHLAYTVQGSTARLYADGVLVDTRPVTGAAPATAGPLRIGGNAVWTGEWFDGLIDEVRVYNRALSAAEIVADRDRPIG